MTTGMKSSTEDTISLPAGLINLLKLHEGDEVKAIVAGQTLRLASLDQFLALRGALQNDEAFDKALELIDRAWQEK